MVSKPIVYGSHTSPTVNAVVITLKALKVDYEFREIKPLKGETRTDEYLRKNPTGTIPTLETEDHQFIGDSHAICAYLVDRYAADDTLYPKDLYRRAKVQQLQHFSNNVLFTTCVKAAYHPLFTRKSKTVPEDILINFDLAYAMLERFLEQNVWVAANHMTVADFNCICSVISMNGLRPITKETYPKILDWYNRMLAISYVRDTLMSEPMLSSRRFLEKHTAISHL
ncbi:glutathione S-transferase 1-like [Haematobia irritans]|uniref:glutathione S-transferase 1-like n=1 Tax=Haematobia irritans TaxID=7368 RepID=UPI003F508776